MTLEEKYEKQKEINKELVDEIEELKATISKMETTTEKNSVTENQ